MPIRFRNLRDYQKNAYGLAIQTAFLNDGIITTEEVMRCVEVFKPYMAWEETAVTKEIRSYASARFIIQALRADGYLVTVKNGKKTAYALTHKWRDFFCRMGCYGDLGERSDIV